MKKRELGRSGISVAPLALGGNVFGWTADEKASFAVLDAFVDAGFDLVDTADCYSYWLPGHVGGESESVIGRWLAKSGKRGKITLATKVGIEFGGRGGLRREHILRSVDESLRRLNTDRIDLYQAHRDDPHAPLDETLAAFAELVRAGKVRALGASNYEAPRLAEALAASARLGVPRFECLQPCYNLCERSGYEAALEPLCGRKGVAVIPYYSLASGFLTGKYRTPADLAGRARGGHVETYMNERGFRILAALDAAASGLGVKPASLALAWLIARPGITAPIASATSVEQLADLTAAARLTLPAETIAALDQASA
jgi:aryl-alcohol dehydrogenase-like predicted oxidoreductase